MITAYLGLGTNLGDRVASLEQAIGMLKQTPGISVQRISSVYETSPVGYLEQPPFYNLAMEILTTLPPRDLLGRILEVERKLHRVRTVRWGPRTIDIDILLYGDQIVNEEGLQIPHPRMTERAFVLVPLYEIAGNILIPGKQQTVKYWLAQLPKDQEIQQTEIRLGLERYPV
ncbi:2-amino-4-hydroxy-6-hydroxymethyldihydropteridine diphosphokinase [Thermoflavimicrobium dichotomicum]|uniref:2-amino-4-hydroxy-6-hydroxymethyldihydropteridine diphosphokinase n=1 Tax=Thermoflavimicrobium dichotomicum TaxID=46223 RepID=A0A1I3QPU5_9BACL|nr:2-amino-4-hydroxy-6-hydroxymethyldihydropteridine diphosphokinase [Thermoflavimicrobium dichotomicum]SFJ36154.1 2-amino-4-hydroxy-6-hydroxymethyldihydropteridinediphosphokinase [Thermoflavimicrobium dichotomicum]